MSKTLLASTGVGRPRNFRLHEFYAEAKEEFGLSSDSSVKNWYRLGSPKLTKTPMGKFLIKKYHDVFERQRWYIDYMQNEFKTKKDYNS